MSRTTPSSEASGASALGASDVSGPASPASSPSSSLVETTGFEVVAESERTGRPSDLFWPWFAANISVFGLSYGTWILDFGISFRQALLVGVLGVVVSFLLCGVVALAGKRGSAPTMALSRAPFGVHGNKLPGVVSWLLSIGWETVLAILATLATATIAERLGWGGGTLTKVAAAVVVAGLIITAAVLGYRVIMCLQSVLTWLTGAITVLYVLLTLDEVDLSAVQGIPDGSAQAMVGALIMTMTGFGLGWINIASDWSRYLPRSTPGGQVVFWNTLGGALAPALLVVFGLLLAGSDEALRVGIAADPIGALAAALPTWFLVPFLVAAVLSLVSGAVLGIYSSGLTLLSLGVRLPRPMAAGVDGVLLTAGTLYVVFVAEDFFGPFQGFLITLGVPIAAWAGVLIADILMRRRDYDEAALFDARGRYGSVAWGPVLLMLLASVVGWGLVTNSYADWLGWQGYLLGPLGLGGREGAWAWSNLGVLVALGLGFLGYLLVGRGRVRRQEERA